MKPGSSTFVDRKSRLAFRPEQPITPERWERVHEALQGALDREPAVRARFMEAVALEDPALHREVDSLLQSVQEPGRFDGLIDRFVAPEPTEHLPARIGAYRPVRLLARGGMGAVYLAERADGAFDQFVAVKLLPAGTRGDLHARFLAERRILARLRHPNIARLLDGGTTEGGLPYLVLEYVAGEPLTTYCDRVRLPIEARLRLFLDVCTAVAWAHTNLVVHRDIKPANVLVMPAGSDAAVPRVKLLDFGIAKLLDDDPPNGSPVTRVEMRLLTPDYAAPEQVRGEPVTTATDVYQLGVLLYELMAGRRPHRLASRTLQEIEREICERQPPRPSEASSETQAGPDANGTDTAAIAGARSIHPGRLARALRGDLDTIILRALSKEPERRYASVDAFATDLRRHLSGLPVQARPDTFRYRTGKFVRRNLAAVLAGSAIAILAVILIASTALQNRRVGAQRDRAEQAAGFVTGLLQDLEPAEARGGTVDPREILDRATERVTTGMHDQPLLQAQLFDVLGRVYQMRGFYAQAEPVLREALALRTARLGADRIEVAESQSVLADLLMETGRNGEAVPLLAAAARTLRLRLGEDNARIFAVEIDQALARRAADDLAGADSILTRAIPVLRQRPPREDLASALLYLGKVRMERGDTESAEPLLREALEIRRSLFGAEHPTVANALDGIGELMQARGDFEGAERAYRDALSIRRVLFPPTHADVGVSLENLGIALEKQGRGHQAVALLDSALAVLLPTFGEEHPLVTVARAYRDSARQLR
jgi:eukaryotic-like serine/threonine-protein kinase